MQKKKSQKPRKKGSKLQEVIHTTLKNVVTDYDIFNCNPEYMYDYMYDISEDKLKALATKSNELAIFNALKKSPLFKKSIEKFCKETTYSMIHAAKEQLKNIEEEKRYAEEDRIADEEYEAEIKANAEKMAEKKKKQRAEMLMLKETLTVAQQKQLKKIYGVDMGK